MDLNIGSTNTTILALIIVTVGICACAGAVVILFGDGGPPPPTIENFGAHNITTTSAALWVDYDTGSWLSVKIRFGYRENFSETWQYTNWHEVSGSSRLHKTISGLSPITRYEFMTVLQHDSSVLSSPVKKFETQAIPPTIELEFTDIDETSAVLRASYDCGSYSEISAQFSYKEIDEENKTTDEKTVSGSGVFSENIPNLTPGMVYQIQTVIRYDNIFHLGDVEIFQTPPLPGQIDVPNYEAIGTLTAVADGDTIFVWLTWVKESVRTRGVHAERNETIRFAGGIDAPETGANAEEGGIEAEMFVRDLCPMGIDVLLDLDNEATYGAGPYRDIYGRLLAVNYIRGDNTWINVNAQELRWGLQEYPNNDWLEYIGFPSEFDGREWLEDNYPYATYPYVA